LTGSFFFNPDITPILNGEFTAIFKGDNAAKDVISWNLHRRHLNESQRAMVAAKLANINHGGDRKSLDYQAANLPDVSQQEAAQMLNVSERSLRTAKKVEQNAIPEIIEKVDIKNLSKLVIQNLIKP